MQNGHMQHRSDASYLKGARRFFLGKGHLYKEFVHYYWDFWKGTMAKTRGNGDNCLRCPREVSGLHAHPVINAHHLGVSNFTMYFPNPWPGHVRVYHKFSLMVILVLITLFPKPLSRSKKSFPSKSSSLAYLFMVTLVLIVYFSNPLPRYTHFFHQGFLVWGIREGCKSQNISQLWLLTKFFCAWPRVPIKNVLYITTFIYDMKNSDRRQSQQPLPACTANLKIQPELTQVPCCL